MTPAERKEILAAASNAAAMLAAFYEWADRVEKAGGATSIEGVAACHAMLKSIKDSKPRANKLVVEPLQAAIRALKEQEPTT